jgi:TatD DNase family protein
MLVDTHCHVNMIIKATFDSAIQEQDLPQAKTISEEAKQHGVTSIINVGTSLQESINCITLAKAVPALYAAIGIHPNDATDAWASDLKNLESFLKNQKENKIVAIGECGLDFHYAGYNLERQEAAFRAQIEMALAYDLALIIHTRDAGAGVLAILEDYKDNASLRGTIHCFSEDQDFADRALAIGFVLGIGGTITYPKNQVLRAVVQQVGLENIILETDAPFLPPQSIRGKKNHPLYIRAIAEYIAELTGTTLEEVATKTTHNAERIFKTIFS